MIQKIRAILHNRRGTLYLETMVCLVILVAGIVSGLSIFSVMLQKKSLDNAADQLVRCIQVHGEVNQSFTDMYQKLTSEYQERPSYQIQATYYHGTNRVQLRDNITVTLALPVKVFGVDLEIRGKGVGINEVYQKG